MIHHMSSIGIGSKMPEDQLQSSVTCGCGFKANGYDLALLQEMLDNHTCSDESEIPTIVQVFHAIFSENTAFIVVGGGVMLVFILMVIYNYH